MTRKVANLDGTTADLKKELDNLEASQKEPGYMPTFRRARSLSKPVIERMDSLQGRAEIRRAIDEVIPKLAAVQARELRAELEMVLTAARDHLV